MKPLSRVTVVEQAAFKIRDGIAAGHWRDELPGVRQLAEEFKVSRDTMRAALLLLEEQGVVGEGGTRGARRILATSGEGGSSRRVLRIAVMASSPLSEGNAHSNELSLSVMHHIKAAGHECIEAPSAQELNYNLKRIGKVVADTKADAWLLFSPSREMLEWFAGQGIACYALGGSLTGRAIPAADALADRGCAGGSGTSPHCLHQSEGVAAAAAESHRGGIFGGAGSAWSETFSV